MAATPVVVVSTAVRSHAEVFKACFNLTKRLMVESMRFFECVVHTETLRVKSFTADYEAGWMSLRRATVMF